ncbi:BadF-type ATPase [Paenibacillus sp. UNCCL117]|uniref:N-acetylglucosamine kinase n=1 Tax=unclassified Paenibacillus TaxID=185978 RepID=UPI0008861697|nr:MULTISPECIES: BadF/BadG/BcrA/BcrD ATPase family protein [unclassified Paenibacillus]SDE49183.1 BadF-type ATPase [Paenibacillus sp. cl123]SFW66829.1 BadF-type ATPase [Paenibacillus sp. UNCCL117]
MYVIGVDGGGTKTAAAVSDLAGNVLAVAQGPGSNPNFVGRDGAFGTLRAVIAEALERAGAPEPAGGAAGLAGPEPSGGERSREDGERLVRSAAAGEIRHAALCVPGLRGCEREAAEASGLPPERLSFDSDVRSTFYGALGRESGLVALAGTGSFVFGANAEGAEARAGGWGPVIGDDGSGQMIAVQALRAVGLAFDGRGPATALTQHALRYYGVRDAHALKSAVRLDNVSKLTYAVCEAADEGDAVAAAILAEAGRALADMAADVAARLGMTDDGGWEAALTGGLPRIGERYVRPFAERLAERCPSARVVPPLLPPIGGALLLALRACGVPWSPALLERLHTSLEA